MNARTQGLLLGFTAYGMWGFFPLFFKLIATVDADQVLLQRVVWSCLFVAALLGLSGRWQGVRDVLKDRSCLGWLVVSALLISTNWLVFIWAVAQQQVLSTSLGYFLTPLISVLLARLFLGERLSAYALVAVSLALLAVVWQILAVGRLPWISLALALSFGIYGLVRKRAPVDTLSGLFIETMLMLPLALLYWGWLAGNGLSQFTQQGVGTTALLIGSGVITALPLLAFAAAAKRLTLTAVGFMMYINPSLQFVTAVWLFGEPLHSHQLVAFGLIWIALGVFTAGAWRATRHRTLAAD
ncbi:EamA family transporter RarD [Motiliproteus sp. SC1-56]|uniref:EamA family transporter RarD n=1 Tax=Motiliproteus sp. SC1-56 TaxID=2799565 RepID=UPI001F5DDE04|nr:EamA family transporter RarD [Motiliproteus sp. SC1-56]